MRRRLQASRRALPENRQHLPLRTTRRSRRPRRAGRFATGRRREGSPWISVGDFGCGPGHFRSVCLQFSRRIRRQNADFGPHSTSIRAVAAVAGTAAQTALLTQSASSRATLERIVPARQFPVPKAVTGNWLSRRNRPMRPAGRVKYRHYHRITIAGRATRVEGFHFGTVVLDTFRSPARLK